MSFQSEAEEIKKKARQQEMKVLVWGPGDPGPSASAAKSKPFQKRLQIKESIRKNFPNAEVYFSEDPEMQALVLPGMDDLEAEELQASIADLIIMLDIGPGVQLELSHFTMHSEWFRNKAYILLPEAYINTKGLLKEIFRQYNPTHLVGYTDQEFKKCVVATVKSVDIAMIAAVKKQIRKK